jgi:protein-S-isoprenylcysteine O-methyltransferase Ste14
MNFLELKIPPVALMFITALLMWLVSWSLPAVAVAVPARAPIATAVAIAGAFTCALGVAAFRRAGTTVNPTKPESTSSLVSSGVYALTRNPMYLGFLLILLGWAIFLANALAFLLIPAFVSYMNRFQIQPEERTLAARFGPEFLAYKAQVRRWM